VSDALLVPAGGRVALLCPAPADAPRRATNRPRGAAAGAQLFVDVRAALRWLRRDAIAGAIPHRVIPQDAIREALRQYLADRGGEASAQVAQELGELYGMLCDHAARVGIDPRRAVECHRAPLDRPRPRLVVTAGGDLH
jgi:hypothetical protein